MFLEISQNSQESTGFTGKETLAQLFSCEFCEMSKNIFFHRTPLVPTSVWFTKCLLSFYFEPVFSYKYASTAFSFFIFYSMSTQPTFEYFFDNSRKLFHTFFLSSSAAIFLKTSVEKDMESQSNLKHLQQWL